MQMRNKEFDYKLSLVTWVMDSMTVTLNNGVESGI